MKVNLYTQAPQFKGVREDRNTTAQLKQNNDYSLTEPNQRRINKAIENLAKQRGEENIKFLLDVGENLTYQTNIENGKATKNEWKSKLRNATEESLAHSNPILKEKYEKEIERVFDEKKELNTDEKAILRYKKSIMKNADMESLKDNPSENIRSLEKNMDYFITSTETPTKQKRYVMKRLAYFMSPEYEINPQLKDKKTQVLAEVMNDITVNTPESKVPNMKAVNQKSHGMCAAISIARKAICYEDKPNYIDSILSELDSSDDVMVYDRQNLGSGKRIPVKKTFIDFDYAQEKGYRIIDASTLQWMNIAGKYGENNENLHEFSAFDKNNYDAYHDAFFIKNIDDETLKKKQSYYQSLVKAKSEIGCVKSDKIKTGIIKKSNKQNFNKNLEMIQVYNDDMKKHIKSIVPEIDKKELNNIYSDLNNLYKPTSEKINKNPERIQKYSFLPNEEKSQKIKKVKQYFTENYPEVADNKILDEKSEILVDTVETINALGKSLNSTNPLSKQIADARKLYNAEATYRASVITGLLDEDNLVDNLIAYNVPDKQTRISEGYAKVINRIEKNNDKKLMEHFAPYFKVASSDKEGIIKGLTTVKSSVDDMMTTGLDDLYSAMGYDDRHTVLLNQIQSSKEFLNTDGKDGIKNASICLKVNNDKKSVLNECSRLEKKLTENPQDEKSYIEAYNKLGQKNQMQSFVNAYNEFTSMILDKNNPEHNLHIEKVKAMNNLPSTATDDDILEVAAKIGTEFKRISKNVEKAQSILEVKNDDGTPYFTTSGREIILKKMENEGKLVPEKSMKKLQERFTRIDKIRSQDEFSSRQGKISDPSLYKLTPEEKIAIKQIDKNINSMYSEVVRNLDYQYREIKEPLLKLANYVGTNEGKYWIQKEGESGLYTDQQVKIFEQMTDKPYYEVEDIDEAVDIVKNGVHSGVSSSSVFHNRMGGHAQYVADIKEFGPNKKDALFHDNTWGASEHENTWIDSEGLMRTDYSDIRGGELGYITDENWRNGNYVENLTHKKGHVARENVESKIYNKINPSANDEFDFTLMNGILLQGKNPAYKDIAGSIKDSLYFSDSAFIKTLEKQAGKMTTEQIQKSIFRNETAGVAYHKKYETIMKRITSDNFNKGIDSLEDYNKLADNDIVKVAFEKAAVRKRYPDATMSKKLAGAKNIGDIEKIKDAQTKAAKSNFGYAFAKSEDILLYAGLDYGEDIVKSLYKALKNNNIPITEETENITKNIVIYEKNEKKQFNGSLKDTIDFVVNKAGKQFDENVHKSDKSEKAKDEFQTALRDTLKDVLYFNKEDLNSNSDKSKGIRNWIDETFEPKSDEEFVEIYRNLQDMKKEDFDKLTKNLTNKQLGINDITGYDMLMKVKVSNGDAKTALKNVLFYDEYKKDINESTTKPSYKYKKLERKTQGARYVGSRTFDDLYRTMNFSLNTLEYDKAFKKYADMNYRKYQALPAYPKVNTENDQALDEKIDTMKTLVGQTINTINLQKNTLYNIELIHKLDEYRKTIPEGRSLTSSEQKTINLMLNEFVTRNAANPDVVNSTEAALKLMFTINPNSNISKYNKHIDVMVNEFREIEKLNSQKELRQSTKSLADSLNEFFEILIDTNIPPRYQGVIRDDIKNWMNEEMKSDLNKNSFDLNKDMIKLNNKISKYSTDNISVDNKAKTDDMTQIIETINKVKNLKEDKRTHKDDEEYTSKVEKQIKEQVTKLDNSTDDFIVKYIKPDNKLQIKAAFNDYSNKVINGGKKASHTDSDINNAKDKFIQDFKKYHLSKQPAEVLKNFVLSSASDAKNKKQKDTYRQYLEDELDMSKFVEIQETLMAAVQTGNAAEVRNYFDEYDVDPYGTGVSTSMNSDDSIDFMIRSLVIQNNTKTGKMFVEKLGLGDRVMKIENKILKKLPVKEKVDNIADVYEDTRALTAIAQEEFSKIIRESDNSADIGLLINKAKKNIIERTKEINDKDNVKMFIRSLDVSKRMIQGNPDIDKEIILNQNYTSTLEDIKEITNNTIKEDLDYINSVDLLYDFLLKLHLPEYSKGHKIQEQLKEDYKEMVKYSTKKINSAMSNSEN